MTQAFNLAQLANNLNTSGQLDATDGLTGLIANANLASSGSASSSTYLRGDRTWASVTSAILGARIVTSQSQQNAAGNNSANDWYAFPGLSAINYAASSTNNVIELRWWAPVLGNATNDSMTTVIYMNGGREDITRNFSGSSGNQRSSFSYWSWITKPASTASRSYQVYWSPSTSGSNVTANLFGGEGANYSMTNQAYLLLIEWDGSVLTGL